MNTPVAQSVVIAAGAERVEMLSHAMASSEIAAVVCVDASLRTVPVPDGVPEATLLRDRQVPDRLLDLIDRTDHAIFARAFRIAKQTGVSGCRVRRARGPGVRSGEEVSLRLFDLEEHFAVFLALVGEFEEEWVDLIALPDADLRARILVHTSDLTGHYQVVDPRSKEVLGWEPEEMVGQSGLDFVHPDDHEIAVAGWLQVLAGGDGSRQRCRFKTKDGRWMWMEVTYRNFVDAYGAACIRVEKLNIEGEMDALAQARSSASQFETLAQSLPVGVVQLDSHGHVVFANEWVRSVTRIVPGSLQPTHLLDATHIDDRDHIRQAVRRCFDGQEANFDLRLLNASDGKELICRARARPLVTDGRTTGVIASIEDVTESVSLEYRLRIEATTDHLTGLLNRSALTERLKELIAVSEDSSPRFACLFIDLDGFKLVNDCLGHQAGDELLITVGNRLRASVRPGDIVARVGGDEFVVLCPWASRAEDVTALADRLMSTVQEPLFLSGVASSVKASVGIAMHHSSDASPDVALGNADMAMYEAKRAGGGRWAIFGDGLRDSREQRFDLHRSLEHAIENGELRMHLQPIFDLLTGDVVGAEALVRWFHPTKGLIMPGAFIEFAAESDLMNRLGWWILNDSCRIAGAVVANGSPDFHIAVNVAGRQLAEANFAEQFIRVVHLHGLEPRHVTLEITETTLIEDGHLVGRALSALSKAGVDVALDDFGTGFSSLNHVRDMPVSILKIDRSYTDRIGSCPSTRAIVEATRDLADKLGFRIIVEGVETVEQKQTLLDMDLRHAQGYLMARPCDEETFLAEYVPLLVVS